MFGSNSAGGILKRIPSYVPKMPRRFRSFTSSQSFSGDDHLKRVDRIKAEFRGFEGGSVDFSVSADDIAIITLNHPARRNAMSGKMMCDFNDISLHLQQQQFKGLIFTAEGNDNNVFCSGGDLNTIKGISNGHDMCLLMHDTIFRMKSLPFISVCVLNGRAIGGGAELTLMPDFRLFSPKGRLAFVQARMGLTSGWGGGKLLVDLIGRRRALELLLSCRNIDSDEAANLGLCDKSVSSREDALKWLRSMTELHDIEVIEAAKHVCQNASQVHPLQEALVNEAEIFAPLFGGPANKKAHESNIKH